MKKNFKIIAILLLSVLLLAGCTKRTTVTNKETNETKNIVTNILCKPSTDEKRIEYSTYKDKLIVDYDKLPECTQLKVNTGGYEGLWISLFVKPFAWVLVKVAVLISKTGIRIGAASALSIMLMGAFLRALMIPITKKSMNMNTNMQKAQKDLNRLEKKYAGKDDKEAMMAKSQEMMAIYKKYDINPMSSCLFAFLQLPIFFAFLEALYRVPLFFENNFLVFNLGTTPLEGLRAGNYWYIILVLLIIGATYFSFKFMNNTSGDEMQQKQMKMMSNFMIIFIGFMSFSLPTSIALYWIVSNGFTIIQNMILKKGKK